MTKQEVRGDLRADETVLYLLLFGGTQMAPFYSLYKMAFIYEESVWLNQLRSKLRVLCAGS